MLIDDSVKTNINKLVVGMFGMPAGGYYSSIESYLSSGGDFASLSVALGGSSVFAAKYPTYYNATQFADALLTNLLDGYSSASPGSFLAARSWVESLYGLAPAGRVALEVISALNSVSSSDPTYGSSKMLLDNRTTVASYYTLSKAGASTDSAYLSSLLAGVTSDSATVNSAISLIDAASGGSGSGVYNLNYASGVTTASIPLTTSTTSISIVSAPSLATLSFIADSIDGSVSLINSANAALSSISLLGGKAVSLDINDSSMVSAKTINGSSMTGALTLKLNDTIATNHTVTGGSGNDVFDFGRGLGALDKIDGKSGTNTLKAEYEATASTDANLVNIQNIVLTNATDLTLTNQTENLNITGSSSTDSIIGGSGNDTIDGGGGNDVIQGGPGSDRITTGDGMDIVKFETTYASNVIDRVTDFTPHVDMLDFRGYLTKSTAPINTYGVPKPLTTPADLSLGNLNLSAGSGATYNIGVVLGAANAEIALSNIIVDSATTIPTTNKIVLVDNAKVVIMAKESDSGAVCNVYFVEDTNTATTAQSWSIKLVGVLENNGAYTTADMANADNFVQ